MEGAGRKVGILLPHTGVYPGLGAMLRDAFARSGWRTAVAHRANPGFLTCDLLLLAGQCRNLEFLPALLRQRRANQPVTVLWQLEPLPPPELSALGESCGLRAAAWSWGRLPLGARRVLNGVIPWRTRLWRAFQSSLARPYARIVTQQPRQEGWGAFRVDNYLATMAEWLWLKEAVAAGWLDHLFASNQTRVEFLRSRGLAASLLPVGYHPDWGERRGRVRDLDVVFLGSDSKGPRAPLVRELKRGLEARGRTLTLALGVYGSERQALLNRAKIMLSLLRVPHDFPGMRVMLGLACGALVVSEACVDSGAFIAGKHLVMCEQPRLLDSIEFFLAHPALRQDIADEGHRYVTEELTLEHTLETILDRVFATCPI